MTLKENLLKYLREEDANELIDSLDKEPLHALLLNPDKMDKETFLSKFPKVTPHPIVKNAFIYDKNIYDFGKSIYHLLGCFYLSEPSALLPAYLLNANKDDIVLDMCAAPGGKSMATSFLMKNEGVIVSNDISKERALIILENAVRLGRKNLIIVNNDFEKIKDYYKDTFTKILLDAPCSGSGMFRKHEGVKNDWTIEKVHKLADLQKSLITSAYHMLKPGGVMCYSTCSFSYEEDEEVVNYLLNNSDAELVNIDSNEMYFISDNNPIGAHLYPSKFPGEGHYVCLIKKPGTYKQKEVIYKEVKFADQIYLSPIFDIKKLNIIRYGIKVCEEKNGIKKFDYHYSRSLTSYDREVELNQELTSKYLKGESINIPLEKGIYLVKYDGLSICLAKHDGKNLKNKIPNYIRVLNKINY